VPFIEILFLSLPASWRQAIAMRHIQRRPTSGPLPWLPVVGWLRSPDENVADVQIMPAASVAAIL
jgi:hypothetical protein